jgi:hypothetical protein
MPARPGKRCLRRNTAAEITVGTNALAMTAATKNEYGS